MSCPAASEVSDEVQRRHGAFAAAADRFERAGERDVVDVVTRGLRHRPVLPPAGHTAVDELRISLETHVGSEPESLHDSRPEALDERVRPGDQAEHRFDRGGLLQVDRDAAPAAQEWVDGRASGRARRAVDAHDVGAHVGQQHRAERAGSDSRELEHTNSL